MSFQVLLFAQLRELAGTSSITVNCSAHTAGELLQTIATMYPALAPALSTSRLAVNQSYAQSHTVIQTTDELALIPPVNGG